MMDNEEVNFFRVIDVRSYEYLSLASLLSFFVSAQRAWRRGPSGEELSLAMRDSQVCVFGAPSSREVGLFSQSSEYSSTVLVVWFAAIYTRSVGFSRVGSQFLSVSRQC